MIVAINVFLFGCTTIPTGGPVFSIERDGSENSSDVDFLPPGPSSGATPTEIVTGFIAAGKAAQDNYRVARSYLSEQVRSSWNPSASLLLRRGEPEVTSESGSKIRYVVPVVASVDEQGRLSNNSSASSQTLDFELIRENNEWRISNLDDGIVLSETAFAEAFSDYLLYYYSRDYRELVPDLRWFARRGDVASRLVRALLDSPTFWLDQGATVTAFPEGTQLATTPIAVSDGIAGVDLTTIVMSADEITRSRMLRQLSATLSQVQGISSARVLVNQTEIAIEPLGDESVRFSSGRDSRVLVLRDRRFGYLQGDSIQDIGGFLGTVPLLNPDSIFYSPDHDLVAANRNDGLWLIEAGESPKLVDPRTGLNQAAIDNCGYVWSSSRTPSADMVQIFSPFGDSLILPMGIDDNTELAGLELARDDTRIAVLAQTNLGVRVLLAAVTRNDACEPVAIGEFVELLALEGRGIDAAWIDDYQVAVVIQETASDRGEVLVVDVSGRSNALGQPSNPRALIGGVGGISGLRILAEDGLIYQPRGSGWQATGESARVIASQR